MLDGNQVLCAGIQDPLNPADRGSVRPMRMNAYRTRRLTDCHEAALFSDVCAHPSHPQTEIAKMVLLFQERSTWWQIKYRVRRSRETWNCIALRAVSESSLDYC